MLGRGRWGDVIITELEQEPKGEEMIEITEPTIGEIKGKYPALVELVQAEGDLAYRARIELLTLWGVFDPLGESAPGDEPPEIIRLRKGVRSLLDERRKLRQENEATRKEVKRLRGIEAAVLGGFSPKDAATQLRLIAGSILVEKSWQRNFEAIADALEADV